MNASKIRELLKTEADIMKLEGDASAIGLADFVFTASDEDLLRFREMLLTDPRDEAQPSVEA